MTSQPIQPQSIVIQSNLNAMCDFSKICRICGANDRPVFPLFGHDAQQNQLVQKINEYLPIVVQQDDAYPLGICTSCADSVMKWHELAQCCIKTDQALTLKLHASRRPSNNTHQASSGSADTHGEVHSRWTPSTDVSNIVSFSEQRVKEHDSDESGRADGLASDDDQPLATIANNTKIDLYQKFYTALINFRNHFTKEHDGHSCSDFSDSSTSDNEEAAAQETLNSFDDLTHSNMRKDKMDEEARLELSRVQTKINGKVYFTCATCGKNLSSTHTYIFHKRIHTGERPCVCHVCGKQFRAPNGLQRHLTETHEKQRRYICVVCPKNFANSQNLKQHMRIHTGERPFVCPHCGKRFTQSGSLHVHLKTHSEHYPHHCAECGAKFRLRSGLARHRLKHTGERPHACALCGKAFRQRHELNGHALTHSDSKPHACAVCGSAFRQRRALRHHCRRLHDAEPPPPFAPAGHFACDRDDLDGEMAVLADHLLARHTRFRIQCDVCKKYVGRYDYNWHVHRHAIQKIKAIEVETKRSYRKRIELRMIRTFPFYHIVRPRNLTGILPIKFHKISKSYNGGHRCSDGSRAIRLRYELEFTDSVTVLMGPDEQICNCTKRATAARDDNRRPETIRHDNHENNVGQSAAPDSPRGAPRAPARTRRSARIAALRKV